MWHYSGRWKGWPCLLCQITGAPMHVVVTVTICSVGNYLDVWLELWIAKKIGKKRKEHDNPVVVFKILRDFKKTIFKLFTCWKHQRYQIDRTCNMDKKGCYHGGLGVEGGQHRGIPWQMRVMGGVMVDRIGIRWRCNPYCGQNRGLHLLLHGQNRAFSSFMMAWLRPLRPISSTFPY